MSRIAVSLEQDISKKSNRGGLREPKGGRPPKPLEEKYRRRLITLPPVTDDQLIEWSIKTDNDISALINRLVIDFFSKAS